MNTGRGNWICPRYAFYQVSTDIQEIFCWPATSSASIGRNRASERSMSSAKPTSPSSTRSSARSGEVAARGAAGRALRVRGVKGGLRPDLRVAGEGLAGWDVGAAGVGRALVGGCVLVCVEQPVLRVEVVELARIAALTGLTVGIAAVIHRRAVMLVVEGDVAA